MELTSRQQSITVDDDQVVTVRSVTQRIVVGDLPTIAVVTAGPMGPAGKSGNAASSASGEQTTPSPLWIIDHNLGVYPTKVLFFSIDGNDELEPEELTYVNENRILASWPEPIAGTWLI